MMQCVAYAAERTKGGGTGAIRNSKSLCISLFPTHPSHFFAFVARALLRVLKHLRDYSRLLREVFFSTA